MKKVEFLHYLLGPISKQSTKKPRPRQQTGDNKAEESKNARRPHGNLVVPGVGMYIRWKFAVLIALAIAGDITAVLALKGSRRVVQTVKVAQGGYKLLSLDWAVTG